MKRRPAMHHEVDYDRYKRPPQEDSVRKNMQTIPGIIGPAIPREVGGPEVSDEEEDHGTAYYYGDAYGGDN